MTLQHGDTLSATGLAQRLGVGRHALTYRYKGVRIHNSHIDPNAPGIWRPIYAGRLGKFWGYRFDASHTAGQPRD